MVAKIGDLIRPTQAEIEELATQETSLEYRDKFRPICAGPVAAAAIIGFAGLAAVPVGLWRMLRAVTRTDGN